jgi:phage terminase large subunit
MGQNTTVAFPDHSNFTNVYWKIQEANTRFVVSRGGAGSSKSVSQHQTELINLLDADYDILFVRKHATDIKDSCFKLLKTIAVEWGIYHLFKWNYSNAQREIINLTTGHQILFRGIDDPEKVKSIVGIKRVVVEEASELTFSDFLELNRRARGMEGIQFTFILNPVSENHWIKRKLIDSGNYSEKLTEIVSTYHDNPFMTVDDCDELERLKLIDENEYRIYVLAEWGIDDKTGKFAWAFAKDKHVGLCDYNPDEMLYLSFDFNVNPITCVCIQNYDETIHVIESIKLKHSNIYELCEVIVSKYPDSMIMVTGDASGKNASAMVKDQLNYYSIIQQQLGLSDGQFNVPTVNPPLAQNRVLVNACLSTMDILINADTNESLIFDLLYVEVDEQNKIIKDNRSDEKQQADILDCFRYYLNTFHRDVVRMNLSYKSSE